jgi:hypothetical protein
MLHGQISNPTVAALQEANKALRLFKNNADVGIHFRKLGELNDLAFVCVTDPAWCTRDDGPSQGGYLGFLVKKDMLEGKEGPYILLDWRSAKFTRMSRSSLNSESQAAAMGVDSPEYVKTFWALMRYPEADPREASTMELAGPSALVIDAKALYDAAQKEHVHNFAEKRTAIEMMVLKDRMRASQTSRRWVSSERQFADGVAKISTTRQVLVDRLRSSMCVLRHDPDFVASKKKIAIQRQREQNQHRRTTAASTTPSTASRPLASQPDEPTAFVTATATSEYTIIQIPASARPWVPKNVKRDRDRRDRLSMP